MGRPYKYSVTATSRGRNLYNRWNAMIGRCYRPSQKIFARYGGRGIKVCERWHDFMNFYADMESTFETNLELERIDNNKEYAPDNCRWATHKEQMNNRSIGRHITINDITKTLAEWCDSVNIKSSTVRQRFYVYGWSIEKSLGIGG